VTSATRPILANSCARAATAEEARFRIDRPIGARSALVVALDDEAAAVVDRLAEKPWRGARFIRGGEASPDLGDVDVVVMIATADADAGVAAGLADACFERGIMTAGLILGEGPDVAATVSGLRPHARNLMVTEDEEDVAEVLTALRA
jgi:hypothetical protein